MRSCRLTAFAPRSTRRCSCPIRRHRHRHLKRNRTARVKLESIWKGPRLPAYVDVHGEAPGCGPNCGSSMDHSYTSGQRYCSPRLMTFPHSRTKANVVG